MTKGPWHGDHGGDAHLRGRPGRTRFVDAHSVSLRCRDCGTLTYRAARELHRAARARCLACGGTLTETEAAQEKQLGTPTQRKARNAAVSAALARVATRPKCWGCGWGAVDAEELMKHLGMRPSCKADYVRDYEFAEVLLNGTPHQLIPETLHVLDSPVGRMRWAVTACGRPVVSPPVPLGILTVGRFALKRDAKAGLNHLLGVPQDVPAEGDAPREAEPTDGFSDGAGI